jgi:Tfp pilus assembly protein PilV
MENQMKKQSGFSLFDVMLAIVVIVVASIGVYVLFEKGSSTNSLTNAENQMVQIAGVYSDLSAADLTNDVPTTPIETLLYNSQRLSEQYFTVTDGTPSTMVNGFGLLTFSDTSPYGFTVAVPLGCVSTTVAQGFYNAVRDQYACDADGNTSCTIESAECVESVTLYYDTNS